eukprot:scaffold377155_cov20-Prasinocladus_malaysianus.AAC.1
MLLSNIYVTSRHADDHTRWLLKMSIALSSLFSDSRVWLLFLLLPASNITAQFHAFDVVTGVGAHPPDDTYITSALTTSANRYLWREVITALSMPAIMPIVARLLLRMTLLATSVIY